MNNVKHHALAIAGLTFSVVYILLEITFNLGLVDFINAKNTEISTFNKLEMLGRVLSSIGFALFFTKMIKPLADKAHRFLSPAFFAVIFGVFYVGETVVFDRIVDNLTPQQKFHAYTFGVYRNLELNNQIDSRILKSEDKNYDVVINSMLGILVNKEETKTLVQNETKKFFAVEYHLDRTSLSEVYDKIQPLTLNPEMLHDYYKRYVIESRRFENYHGAFKNKYRENFTNTIGIEPSLDEASFNEALKQKHKPSVDLGSIVIVPRNDKIKMPQLTLADIPEDLSKEQWIDYINNHVQTAINKTSLNTENIDNLPHARNIISSVIITPIAIILSLISIVLNTGALLGKRYKIIGFAFVGIISLIAMMWSYNPYSVNPVLNKVIGLETHMVKGLSFYKDAIHRAFVNDDNPNLFDVVRIEKPKLPDISASTDAIKEKFEALSIENNSTENSAQQQEAVKELYVDDNKLENKNYYGELNKKNPYAK